MALRALQDQLLDLEFCGAVVVMSACVLASDVAMKFFMYWWSSNVLICVLVCFCVSKIVAMLMNFVLRERGHRPTAHCRALTFGSFAGVVAKHISFPGTVTICGAMYLASVAYPTPWFLWLPKRLHEDSRFSAGESEKQMHGEVPKKLTGKVELHRNCFRAHMQVRFKGKNLHFCGPSHRFQDRAEEDLEELRGAKHQRSKGILIEELHSVCKRLSKKKADENALKDLENDAEVQELIKSAFEALDLTMVERFLEHGISIDRGGGVKFRGCNLLMRAAWLGNYAVARRLLERHANVEACTTEGETALHFAFCRGHVEVAEVLLKCGADPTAETSSGWDLWDYAINFAPYDKVAEMRMLLFECGVKEMSVNREDWVRRRRAEKWGSAYRDWALGASEPPPVPGGCL